MRISSWNCHGLGNPRAVRALKKLIRRQVLDLVFVMETRRKSYEVNSLRHLQGLANIAMVDCMGEGKERVGGLLLMWSNKLDVRVLSFSLNHIDMEVEDMGTGYTWSATGIYGFPDGVSKHKTWELIQRMSREDDAPWKAFGDFNLISASFKKRGGSPPNVQHVKGF